MHPFLLQKFPLPKAVPIWLFIFSLSCFNNDAQTKGIKKCQIVKCKRTVGPTFQDFGDFKHVMLKQNETRSVELQNAEGLWA
jgi:hypothetical protein